MIYRRFPRTSRAFLYGCTLLGLQGCGTQISLSGNGTKVVVNGQTFDLKETETEIVRQNFQASAAPRVIVDVFSGKITVNAASGKTIDVEITKTCAGETKEEAKANLKLIDVQMKQDGETLRVTARRPDAAQAGVVNGLNADQLKKQFTLRSADAVVKVPAGASLELKTAYGDVKIEGIAGRVEAETSSGAVKVTNGSGELRLKSNYGDLTIDGRNTAVTAATASGKIIVKGAKGPLDISSGYGDLSINGPSEKVSARTASGNIVVKGAAGSVQAKSGYGKVDVDQAPAGATLETNSGDIRLRAARGTVKVTSGYGRVDAEVDGAAVTASTNSGNIQVSGRLGDGEHSLHSGYGKVVLALPADSQFRLDARTNFGRVTTGFGIPISGETSGKHAVGSVGEAPKTVIKLTTNSGDIELRKQ